ncbi:MAG: hypothetical protein RLN89_02850 [Parvibaculum sp.]
MSWRLTGRLLCLMSLVAVVLSCSPARLFTNTKPYAQQGLEIPGFQELCDTKGGLHVYKTVDDAKGFVLYPRRSFDKGSDGPVTDQGRDGCLNCLEYLVRDGFEFVEATYHAPEDLTRLRNNDYARSSGKFRYSLRPRSEGMCNNYDYLVATYPPVKRVAEEFADQIGDRCLVAQPISDFTARYDYLRDSFFISREDYQGEDGFVESYHQIVRDRMSGEVLVEHNYYMYLNLNFSPPYNRACRGVSGHNIPVGEFLRAGNYVNRN